MVRGADCEELLLSLADDVKLDAEADDDDEKAAVAAAASETEDNEKPTTSRSSRSAYVGHGNVQAPRESWPASATHFHVPTLFCETLPTSSRPAERRRRTSATR